MCRRVPATRVKDVDPIYIKTRGVVWMVTGVAGRVQGMPVLSGLSGYRRMWRVLMSRGSQCGESIHTQKSNSHILIISVLLLFDMSGRATRLETQVSLFLLLQRDFRIGNKLVIKFYVQRML